MRWVPDEPVFQLEVEVTANDPDRPQDVEGAALVVPDLGFSATLERDGEGRFAATLGEDELPAPGVEALLGQTLRIEVRDASGNASLGPPMSLVRIIEFTPQTLSPQWPAQVSPTPTLVWRPAQLPFAFTYGVDVFLVDAAGIPNLIDTETHRDLDPSVTSLPVTTELEPGDYYWTLWVIDSFGNRSRSREAGFRVP